MAQENKIAGNSIPTEKGHGEVSPNLQSKNLGNPPGGIDVPQALKRLREIEAELEVRNALWEEQEKITLALIAQGFIVGEAEGLTFIAKDNFAAGNSAWKTACVKRFEIEIFTKEQMERRAKRKAKKEAADE